MEGGDPVSSGGESSQAGDGGSLTQKEGDAAYEDLG